jgi:hypothetical protein
MTKEENFVLALGQLLKKIDLPLSIKNEMDLEYAILPHIKNFLLKELVKNGILDDILYHHGRTAEEKKSWAKSKSFQVVKLFGANVSDIFIRHPHIGAIALELKYVKLDKHSKGLTGSIQRAIGQSLIAILKHPFAICFVVYASPRKLLKAGAAQRLKELLWNQHKIYLLIRRQTATK